MYEYTGLESQTKAVEMLYGNTRTETRVTDMPLWLQWNSPNCAVAINLITLQTKPSPAPSVVWAFKLLSHSSASFYLTLREEKRKKNPTLPSRIFVHEVSEALLPVLSARDMGFSVTLSHSTKPVPKSHRGATMKPVMEPRPVSTLFQWLAFTQLLREAPVTLFFGKLSQHRWQGVVTAIQLYCLHCNLP